MRFGAYGSAPCAGGAAQCLEQRQKGLGTRADKTLLLQYLKHECLTQNLTLVMEIECGWMRASEIDCGRVRSKYLILLNVACGFA